MWEETTCTDQDCKQWLDSYTSKIPIALFMSAYGKKLNKLKVVGAAEYDDNTVRLESKGPCAADAIKHTEYGYYDVDGVYAGQNCWIMEGNHWFEDHEIAAMAWAVTEAGGWCLKPRSGPLKDYMVFGWKANEEWDDNSYRDEHFTVQLRIGFAWCYREEFIDREDEITALVKHVLREREGCNDHTKPWIKQKIKQWKQEVDPLIKAVEEEC